MFVRTDFLLTLFYKTTKTMTYHLFKNLYSLSFDVSHVLLLKNVKKS